MWEQSFIAASVLIGGTVDDAASMLAPEAAARARALALVEGLADTRRAARAQALAVVGQEIARALDEVTLR